MSSEQYSEDANGGDNQDFAGGSKWSKNGFGEFTRQSSGKFSKEESETVRKAVSEFCALKSIPVARLCSECDHKAELKGAWMEIAKRLPHRSVQSVYRHGLRQLHPFKRGAWTEDEVETLDELVARMGKKWAAIQQKLNRSADSCRDKYRELNDDFIRGRWKENETELLKRLIREHLGAPANADIKELGRMVQQDQVKIPWSTISKRMGKRSRLSCFKKWQKMTGLFSPSDQYKQPAKDGASSGVSAGAKAEEAATATAVVVTKATVKPPPATHAAPTAGAAAALAATSVNNPINSATSGAPGDFDLYLLSELVSSGATRSSDVSWDTMRLENAQNRWNELLEEWQAQDGMDESALALPLSEIAQLILEGKTSAQRAAETVEAVDLPNPESLHTPSSNEV